MCVVCYNFSFAKARVSHDWLWENEKLCLSSWKILKTLESTKTWGMAKSMHELVIERTCLVIKKVKCVVVSCDEVTITKGAFTLGVKDSCVWVPNTMLVI